MARLFVVIIGLLSILPTHVLADQYKTFKDWNVVCTNGLVCWMETYPENKGIYSLGFSRGTEADAPLDLTLSFDGTPKKGSNVEIKFPGQTFGVSVLASAGTLADDEWEFPLEIERENLVAALKAGKNVAINIETDKMKINAVLSLSGVVASMLFIDETQGRVGHVDALQAKGDKAAEEVETRVSDLEEASELPEKVKTIWAGSFNECEDGEPDNIAKHGGMRIELDNDGHLFILPCGTPGAYNQPYVAIVYDIDSKNARMVPFPTMGNRGPSSFETAYNVNWNDKKSQLDAFFKGRGIGDCGSKHIWEWDGYSYDGAFELIEERLKDDCDENFGEFPLIWPPD